MARYLLDTNVISEAIRDPRGDVGRRLSAVPQDTICTSVIVACELRYGAAKRASKRLSRSVEEVLAALAIMPFAAPADLIYGDLRARLERRGWQLGANDLLIAAHAIALDCVVVTADRAFARVPRLSVENWRG